MTASQVGHKGLVEGSNQQWPRGSEYRVVKRFRDGQGGSIGKKRPLCSSNCTVEDNFH